MEPLKAPWDNLVLLTETDRMRPPGIQRLKLLKTPVVRVQKTVDRSMAAVDDRLRAVFRRLTAGQAKWPLLLHGSVGSGKTLAALSLCDYMLGFPYFTTAEDLTNNVYDLSAYCWQRSKGIDEDRTALHVVDEVGVGHPRSDPHMREYKAMKRFADNREHYAQRCAIYISNVDPDALKRVYDKRIANRITCGEVFELTGESRR